MLRLALPAHLLGDTSLTKTQKWLLITLLLLATLSTASILGIRYWFSTQQTTKAPLANTLIPIDFSEPDAFIQSQSLAQLPRDLLKVPLLKATLTEEFAFYYEQQEARLSLAGTLRRLAYEHELTISDQFIQQLLASPAELALWRGPNGKLDYWMLTLQQNLATRLLQSLATLALDDSQLSKLGEFKVTGQSVPLYLLHYGYQHQLLFAAQGERLVILSDPGMLLGFDHPKVAPQQESTQTDSADQRAGNEGTDDDIQASQTTAQSEQEPHLLAAQLHWVEQALQAEGERVGYQGLQLQPLKQGHTLVVGANYLSFGYQRFFPAIHALRFDFDGKQWASQALLNEDALKQPWNNSQLWQAIPTSPAACASLPLDWSTTQTLASQLAPKLQGLPQALQSLTGPIATCWYEKSRLASPLFVARFADAQQAEAASPILGKLFTQIIGASEFVRGDRFPVQEQELPSGHYWKRIVSARYGSQLAGEEAFKPQLSAARYFPVTLAVSGPYLFFSPDGNLVEQSVAVQEKRYPAVADGLSTPELLVATFTPSTLAPLIEREMYASLPGQIEPLFRAAAKNYLAPRLKTLASFPPLRLSLRQVPGGGVLPLGSGRHWEPVDIQFAK